LDYIIEPFDTILDWFSAIFFILFLFGVYAVPAGLTFARTRLYLMRNTDTTKKDALGNAAVAGALWPVTVPWFLMARLVGSVDPQTVAEKKHLARQAEAKREQEEAKSRALVEEARLREEIALRQRLRLAGEEIPYTEEERLALTERENAAAQQHLAIEQRRNAKGSSGY